MILQPKKVKASFPQRERMFTGILGHGREPVRAKEREGRSRQRHQRQEAKGSESRTLSGTP
jgi:hypothetical protein